MNYRDPLKQIVTFYWVLPQEITALKVLYLQKLKSLSYDVLGNVCYDR